LDGFSVDPYKEWSFSPVYKEEGLVMESSKAIPLISQYSGVCLPSIGKSFKGLIISYSGDYSSRHERWGIPQKVQ
jgi:hypothetical protein